MGRRPDGEYRSCQKHINIKQKNICKLDKRPILRSHYFFANKQNDYESNSVATIIVATI